MKEVAMSGVTKSLTLATLLLSVMAARATAAQLHVPAQYPTIQQAIGAASDGDTILVAPGTYVERINYLGKRLVVQSAGGAAVTTIDGNGGGTVITVNGAEPQGTELKGFTVTGGTDGTFVFYDGQYPWAAYAGGGVFVGLGGHLQLTHCVVTGNSVSAASGLSHGGGLAAVGATVKLEGCTFSGNTAEQGAAIATMVNGSTLDLNDCVITANVATGTILGVPAAAMTIEGSTFKIVDSVFSDNLGTGLTSNTVFYVDLSGTRFINNTGWGYASYHPIEARVAGASFLGNGLGGAHLYSGKYLDSWIVAEDCTFANGDDLEGFVDSLGEHFLTNCTFDGASVLTHYGTVVHVQNCIVRHVAQLVQGDVLSVETSYSDIEGGAPGPGNIDVDPLWVNPAAGDYSLSAASPCIDAGDPASELDADLTTVDMGGVAYALWTDLGGGVPGGDVPAALGKPVLVGQGVLAAGVPVGLKLTAPHNTAVILLAGASPLGVPFKGGTLWPSLDLVAPQLTPTQGPLSLGSTWPPGVPSGTSVWVQIWYPDAAGPAGFAASNGVVATVP